MSTLFEKLQPYLDKAYAYRTALTMLSWAYLEEGNLKPIQGLL